jgi:hypothetical protein
MTKNRWVIAVSVLMLVSMACNFLMNGTQNSPASEQSIPTQTTAVQATLEEPTQAESEPLPTEQPTQPESALPKVETEFPLPEGTSGLMDLGNGAINFQAKITIKEAITFYRESFAKLGYKEREINTAITDLTFNLVFDGHSSGKAIVVQGVDLGAGGVNINIRLEDI